MFIKNKRNLRIRTGALALSALMALTGCGAAAGGAAALSGEARETAADASDGVQESSAASGSGDVSGGTEQAGETRVIIDQVGNEVELPAQVNRIVIASAWPLASVYCLFDGSVEKLVGVDPAIISAAENSMLVKVAPEIVNVESGFSQNGVINAEELLKLDPDVVLYATGVPEDYEICSQAGIPAVGFSLSIKDYNAVETINSWVELLGEVLGEDLTNEEFIRYGQDMQAMVAERLQGVKEEDKPKAMFIHGYDASTVNVPAADSWGDYWITASGGINVGAQAGSGTPTVGAEQIYEWNPDRIFIDNFNDALPEDIYSNTLANFDWSSISAVQNQQVIKTPLGMYRWYVTCSDSALMLLWMAKQNQPELFADIDMNQTVKDFYQQFYGVTLTDADVEYIFTPKREAAGGI